MTIFTTGTAVSRQDDPELLFPYTSYDNAT